MYPFFTHYTLLTLKNYKLRLLKSFLGRCVLHYYHFCNINNIHNILSHFTDFEKVIFILLTLNRSYLFYWPWTGHILSCDLLDAMPRQRSLTLFSHVTYGTLATLEATNNLLTCDLRDAMPRQRPLTLFFLPTLSPLPLYLGKQTIFLGVISILSLYLCLHTKYTYH